MQIRAQWKAQALARRVTTPQAAKVAGVSTRQFYRWLAGEAQVKDLDDAATKLGMRFEITFGEQREPAPERERVEGVANAVVTRLESRLRLLEDAIASRVAEETSRLVQRSVARTEQDADDPDQTDDQPHVAGQGG